MRIAIIFCLLRRPSIIVADEMESSMGDALTNKTLSLLKRLQMEYPLAILWITHDQEKAKNISNRIWSLDKGKLVFDGKPQDFYLSADKRLISNKPSGTNLLNASNINKKYPISNQLFNYTNREIVNDASFNIHYEEIVGLIGDSGSGKSTMAKILAGIETYDQGEIMFEGKPLNPSEYQKGIVYAFQDTLSALNPAHTCGTILKESIEVSNGIWTLNDLLTFGKLENSVLDKYPIEISGGMRQRIMILRSIATNPKLLILDESLNGLQLGLQREILDLLTTYMQSSRMSLLLISHQMDLISNYCNRIYRIESGKMILI